MWGERRGEDCTNFARFFIRTMRCFIFSVKTMLVKTQIWTWGRAVTTVHITAKKQTFYFVGSIYQVK